MTKSLQVPDYIAARIQKNKELEVRSSIFDSVLGDGEFPPRISIRAARFRMVENAVETVIGTELDVVIVGANPHTSKAYYAKAYNPDSDEQQLPDCWSDNGIRPDARVADPVHPNCADCPHNVLGSKINPSGAKSKKCADSRLLAVVPASDPSKVYQLSVPVGSMKNMREYFKGLANYGIDPEMVVTTLSFDEEASAPKLMFEQKKFVPSKALDAMYDLGQSDEVKAAIRVQEGDAALPAPEKKAAEEEPEPEKPAPPKRTKKKAAPPPEPDKEEDQDEEDDEAPPTAGAFEDDEDEKPAKQTKKKEATKSPRKEDATPTTAASRVDEALGDMFGDDE